MRTHRKHLQNRKWQSHISTEVTFFLFLSRPPPDRKKFARRRSASWSKMVQLIYTAHYSASFSGCYMWSWHCCWYYILQEFCRYFIPHDPTILIYFPGFYTSQVVQDFFHQKFSMIFHDIITIVLSFQVLCVLLRCELVAFKTGEG